MPISLKDFKKALIKIKLNKTPDPVGHTTLFYLYFFFQAHPPKNDSGSTQKTNTTRHTPHTSPKRQLRHRQHEKSQAHLTL